MRFYMAPMEGITGYVFRNAVNAQFGDGIDKYFTPFIEPHINKGCMKTRERNDVLPEHNKGMYVVPQILTNSAEAFLLCERNLAEYGYKELNLNLGCPSPTVTTKFRGSGLLQDKSRLDEMLSEIFEKTSCEVSVKTRIGYADPEEWPALLEIYNKYPLKELIIHPRARNEFYSGTVHTDAFIYTMDSSRHPLCYNGDICSEEDYDRLMSRLCGTGRQNVEAVMIGRGMVSDPSLLQRLKARTDISGSRSEASVLQDADISSATENALLDQRVAYRNTTHTGKQISATDIRIFTDNLLTGYSELLSGDTPVLHKMKEVWSWLITGFPDSDRLIKRIVKAKKMQEYKAAVSEALNSLNK